MDIRLLLKTLALAACTFLLGTDLRAQGCTNPDQYPSATTVPGAVNVLTNISTCTYLQEYSAVGPVVVGMAYEFSIAEGGYITVREGTATGPVIAQGYSPVVAVPTAAGTLYAHWNVDANCATSTGCKNTNVMTLSCIPPTVTATVVEDCPNGQFSVSVDVTALGDAASVDVNYTVNGGPVQTLAAQPVGTYSIGPFTAGQLVNVTVADVGDSTCNRSFTGLGSTNCPVVVDCGGAPLDQTYCYINNDNRHWHYQSSNDTLPLILIFSSGTIESFTYDKLRIYDGPDNQSPLLYSNLTGSNTNLTGVQVVAPSGHIYMEVTSEGSTSCATNTGWTWNWQVGCLDCNPAEATYLVSTDCDAQSFTIDVHVTSLGSDPTLDITNDAGAAIVTATDTGTYSVGPFPITTLVTLTLVNDNNSLCNVESPVLTNPLCPTHITCGEPALQQTYCYTNNDNHEWHWQNTDPNGTLALLFSAGTISGPGSFGDNLIIYDGPTSGSSILYQNTASTNLADLLIQSTGPDIYMQVTTSGFGSCGDGNETEWAWEVGCYDCTPPAATYTVNTDCDAQHFTVDVHITDMGSQGNLDITNDAGAATVAVADTGVYTVGPFPITTLTTITLENDTNSLCSVHSPVLTNPLCATFITCGGAPLDQTYCYTNNDSHQWHWQAATPGLPLILIFSSGKIESTTYDQLKIYDGPDNLSPQLYINPTGTTDLTGVQVIATSGEIYMEVTSEGSVSCATTTSSDWTWNWQVGCLDCVPPVATYTVNTDCAAQNFTIDVDITTLGSDATLDIVNNAGADTVTATAAGTYTVGPFPITTLVTLTLANDENTLCSVTSPVLTNPLCESVIQCGGAPLDQTYCYSNNDSHAWAWGSSGVEPLIIVFSAGTIESQFGTVWDHVRIYNGTDNTAPLIYENVANDGILTGVQAIAPSGHMYMEMTSEGGGSCADGGQSEWVWQVGCLDCNPPEATFNVVSDCDSMQFVVEVNLSVLGSDPVLDITNDGGALPIPATATGTYTVGPFEAGDTVVVTLENDVNTLCSIHSVPLTNPLCPTVVQCGIDPIADTYCYGPNDHHEWHWQSSGGQPLAIEFSAGTIESAFTAYDHIRIYDGVNNLGTLLYENVGGNDNLAGVLQIASSGDLYMESTSDGSNSCQGSTTYVPWAWEVGCLDCTNPGATFSVVEDCIHHAFSVQVNVDSTGSSSTVRIANSLTSDTLLNVPAGITTVGPFPKDSTVVLTVMNESNGLCRVFSPAMTSQISCVDSVCAAEAYEYCYTNHDTAWFAYQGTANVPLTIQFLWGQLLANDYVQVFDGGTIAAPMLWQGNMNGNMSGFAINTTNADRQLLMRVVSSATGSCATGEASPQLHWVVQCGAVGVNELASSDFSMYPNPTNGELTLRLPSFASGPANMQIVDMTGRSVFHKVFNNSGGLSTFDLKDLQNGNYIVTITTNDWVKSQRLQITH